MPTEEGRGPLLLRLRSLATAAVVEEEVEAGEAAAVLALQTLTNQFVTSPQGQQQTNAQQQQQPQQGEMQQGQRQPGSCPRLTPVWPQTNCRQLPLCDCVTADCQGRQLRFQPPSPRTKWPPR